MSRNGKNDNVPKWYIAACRPNFEAAAAEAIIRLGQTVFLPSYRRESRHHRLKTVVKKTYPLMVGYLFFLASDHWSRVLDCEHVTRVLRSQKFGESSVPIAIPDATVQTIRSAQDRGQFDRLLVDAAGLKRGDEVAISEGLFAGRTGEVDAVEDENIVLWIDAVCGRVRTSLPVEQIRNSG